MAGEERPRNHSPQPAVNNFTAAMDMDCEQLAFRQKKGEHAWPGRRIVNPKRSTFLDRISLRAKRLTSRNALEPFARNVWLRRRTTIRLSSRRRFCSQHKPKSVDV